MINCSGCLIVKNEAKNIKKCIKSIQDVCNEIIVIDTGSTDGTLDILKTLNVKLFKKKWNDNFADMRNYAKSKCTGDYILMIDGDETLNKFEVKEPNDYIVCEIAMDSELGQRLRFPSIRFFKNDSEIRYEGKRHSIIDYTVLDKIKGTGEIVFNHPKMSRKELTKKMLHNLKIHKEQLITEPNNETVNYHLARKYYYLQDWNNAIEYAEKVLSNKVNKSLKVDACIFLYLALCNQGRREYGLQFLSLSLQLIPNQVLTRYLLYLFFKEIKEKKLMNETLQEINKISKIGKSDLPNDIFFNNEKLRKEL